MTIEEQEKMKHCCCFTGHRPEKLNISNEALVGKLRLAIKDAIHKGYTTFISGMAPGVDIIAAQVVLEFREKLNIELICAIPYSKFGKTKDYHHNVAYKRIIECANDVVVVSNSYNKWAFQKRNAWMVDHSSLVIAVCHKEEGVIIPGGTKNTIEYAERLKRDIKYIEV